MTEGSDRKFRPAMVTLAEWRAAMLGKSMPKPPPRLDVAETDSGVVCPSDGHLLFLRDVANAECPNCGRQWFCSALAGAPNYGRAEAEFAWSDLGPIGPDAET